MPKPKPPKNPPAKSKPGPKGIPIGLLVEYSAIGLTDSEIAKLVGCHRSSVSQQLRPHREALKNLDTFKNRRADIMALLGRQLLYSLSESDIKAMPPGSRVLAYCQLYDKERLERNQSTENVDFALFDRKISDLDKEIIDLETTLADAGRLLPVPDDCGETSGGPDSGGPG